MAANTPVKSEVIGPLRVSEAMAARIRKRAADEQRSASSVIRMAIASYLGPDAVPAPAAGAAKRGG